MRIAFSIILNGMHHLLHKDYYKTMIENFDLWVVSEGASLSKGTTSWCKDMSENYHNNGRSVDGTLEFLTELSNKYSNLKCVVKDGMWESKDEQVNGAIYIIKSLAKSGMLFQVDIDEQWDKESLSLAEEEMREKKLKTGACLADCYIGKDIVAKGQWGELYPRGYIRVWNWEGEYFLKHEPPTLNTNNEMFGTLSARFKHYNYYFEEDVKFKNDWYGGHEGIYEKWKNINSLGKESFPLHISNLISGPWGQSNTFLVKV